MRDLRSIQDSNLRAAARISQMKQEPLIVFERDVQTWLADLAAKRPLSLPFPALGETVPMAWQPARHHYVRIDPATDEGREQIADFIRNLKHGRGYGIVAFDQQHSTAIIAEFTRTLN